MLKLLSASYVSAHVCVAVGVLTLNLCGLTLGCSEENPQPRLGASMTHGGVERTYLLHVPESYDGSAAVPLVLALHGFSGSALSMRDYTFLDRRSDQEGFIIAYPNGLAHPSVEGTQQYWNAGGMFEQWTNGTDDIGFLGALIVKLSLEYAIDQNRIFVTGHSNGGFMTYRVASELSHVVAAIAPVAGPMLPGASPGAPEPLSILHIHAQDDSTVLPGGMDLGGQPIPAVQTALSAWAQRYQCATEPVVTSKTDALTIQEWTCPGGSIAIDLYLTTSGNHSWPTALNHGLSAADVIWDFFSSHPKPAEQANPADES